MKSAIALITYTRSDYFELTVASILNQKIDGASAKDHFDFYIFQDGLAKDASPEDSASHQKIKNIVGKLGGKVTFVEQKENLGIGLHFDFVERYLFLDKGYEYAGFFEDDLVVAPDYLKAFGLLRDKFKDDPRVGMISAVPGVFQRPLDVQIANLYDYAPMGHSWAFGLSRDFWLRRQPFVDDYLKFIKNIRYRDRPHAEISNWLIEHGIRPTNTSQDYIKQSATVKLGAICLATFPNFGLYIGRVGVHWNRAAYKASGFGNSVVCNKALDKVADLTKKRFEEIQFEENLYFMLSKDSISEEDVRAAYRLILGRNAENSKVIEEKSQLGRYTLIEGFLTSREFLSSPFGRRVAIKINDTIKNLVD